MVNVDQQYCTYVIYSRSLDQYYVGHTQEILERVEKYHNAGRTIYTKRGIPWKLVYSETFKTRAQAMRREREIKARKSRTYIEKLVQSVPSHS